MPVRGMPVITTGRVMACRVESRVFRHGFDRARPAGERADHLAPGDAPSPLAEMRVIIHRHQQNLEARQIIVRTKIVAPHLLRDQIVQLVNRIGKAFRWCKAFFESSHVLNSL